MGGLFSGRAYLLGGLLLEFCGNSSGQFSISDLYWSESTSDSKIIMFSLCHSISSTGICTGPKREFFACLCKDIIDPKRGLFIAADDAQYR